eukprot:EG_transcript_229
MLVVLPSTKGTLCSGVVCLPVTCKTSLGCDDLTGQCEYTPQPNGTACSTGYYLLYGQAVRPQYIGDISQSTDDGKCVAGVCNSAVSTEWNEEPGRCTGADGLPLPYLYQPYSNETACREFCARELSCTAYAVGDGLCVVYARISVTELWQEFPPSGWAGVGFFDFPIVSGSLSGAAPPTLCVVGNGVLVTEAAHNPIADVRWVPSNLRFVLQVRDLNVPSMAVFSVPLLERLTRFDTADTMTEQQRIAEGAVTTTVATAFSDRLEVNTSTVDFEFVGEGYCLNPEPTVTSSLQCTLYVTPNEDGCRAACAGLGACGSFIYSPEVNTTYTCQLCLDMSLPILQTVPSNSTSYCHRKAVASLYTALGPGPCLGMSFTNLSLANVTLIGSCGDSCSATASCLGFSLSAAECVLHVGGPPAAITHIATRAANFTCFVPAVSNFQACVEQSVSDSYNAWSSDSVDPATCRALCWQAAACVAWLSPAGAGCRLYATSGGFHPAGLGFAAVAPAAGGGTCTGYRRAAARVATNGTARAALDQSCGPPTGLSHGLATYEAPYAPIDATGPLRYVIVSQEVKLSGTVRCAASTCFAAGQVIARLPAEIAPLDFVESTLRPRVAAAASRAAVRVVLGRDGALRVTYLEVVNTTATDLWLDTVLWPLPGCQSNIFGRVHALHVSRDARYVVALPIWDTGSTAGTRAALYEVADTLSSLRLVGVWSIMFWMGLLDEGSTIDGSAISPDPSRVVVQFAGGSALVLLYSGVDTWTARWTADGSLAAVLTCGLRLRVFGSVLVCSGTAASWTAAFEVLPNATLQATVKQVFDDPILFATNPSLTQATVVVGDGGRAQLFNMSDLSLGSYLTSVGDAVLSIAVSETGYIPVIARRSGAITVQLFQASTAALVSGWTEALTTGWKKGAAPSVELQELVPGLAPIVHLYTEGYMIGLFSACLYNRSLSCDEQWSSLTPYSAAYINRLVHPINAYVLAYSETEVVIALAGKLQSPGACTGPVLADSAPTAFSVPFYYLRENVTFSQCAAAADETSRAYFAYDYDFASGTCRNFGRLQPRDGMTYIGMNRAFVKAAAGDGRAGFRCMLRGTATPTPSGTRTATGTPTGTRSRSATHTATLTATQSATASVTATATPVPTASPTLTLTPEPVLCSSAATVPGNALLTLRAPTTQPCQQQVIVDTPGGAFTDRGLRLRAVALPQGTAVAALQVGCPVTPCDGCPQCTFTYRPADVGRTDTVSVGSNVPTVVLMLRLAPTFRATRRSNSTVTVQFEVYRTITPNAVLCGLLAGVTIAALLVFTTLAIVIACLCRRRRAHRPLELHNERWAAWPLQAGLGFSVGLVVSGVVWLAVTYAGTERADAPSGMVSAGVALCVVGGCASAGLVLGALYDPVAYRCLACSQPVPHWRWAGVYVLDGGAVAKAHKQHMRCLWCGRVVLEDRWLEGPPHRPYHHPCWESLCETLCNKVDEADAWVEAAGVSDAEVACAAWAAMDAGRLETVRTLVARRPQCLGVPVAAHGRCVTLAHHACHAARLDALRLLLAAGTVAHLEAQTDPARPPSLWITGFPDGDPLNDLYVHQAVVLLNHRPVFFGQAHGRYVYYFLPESDAVDWEGWAVGPHLGSGTPEARLELGAPFLTPLDLAKTLQPETQKEVKARRSTLSLKSLLTPRPTGLLASPTKKKLSSAAPEPTKRQSTPHPAVAEVLVRHVPHAASLLEAAAASGARA